MHSFAQALVPWALPGIILVTAIGALVMCLLVFRYGFPPAHESASRSVHDATLITRAGHALAGACFAIAALLAVVVLGHAARSGSPPAPSAQSDVVASGEVDTLRQALGDMEAQLARAESRLSGVGDLEARVSATETSLHRVSEDLARARAATKQLTAVAPPRRPAAVTAPRTPAPASPPRTASDAPTASPAALSPRRAAPPAPEPARSQEVGQPVATEPPSTSPRAVEDPEPDLGTRIRADWELIKREGRDAFRRLREALRELP